MNAELLKEKNQTDARVSVVMCTYNGEKYLKEQVDSILNQTYPIYELIVQDDCSTDGTIPLLKSYQDPRIKVFINRKRGGYNRNFNTAISRAGGDYIALSDQDDVWRKDKIEVLIRNMKGYAFLFHDSILFTKDIDHPTGYRKNLNCNVNEVYMLMKPFPVGHTFFFSKKILPKLLELTAIESNVAFERINALVGSAYGIKYVSEGLTYWRRHPAATTYDLQLRIKNYKSIHGIVKAFATLLDKKRRRNTQRYFYLASKLDFQEKAAVQIANYMKSGKTIDILKACFVCMKNRHLFYKNSPFYKSLFIPLYFIRDYGYNII